MPKPAPFIIVTLLVVLLSACNLPANRKSTPTNPSQPTNFLVETYPVDPIFQDLYDFLGGETMVGPAIAPMIESGDLKSQYLQAAQMIFDPLAPESDRYQLESLGRILGVAEPPVPDPGLPEVRYTNGHIILDEFVPMYEQLGGARFVGRPLTEGRHNPEKNRIEQYFENLGFYRLENEEPGTVHLMAYGAMTCPQDCRSQPLSSSIPSRRAFLPPPFSTAASQLGLDFTGLTLTSPHLGDEGNMEVIFENLVLMMDTDSEMLDTPEYFVFQLWLPKILSNFQKSHQNQYEFNLWVPVTVKILPGERMVAQVEMVNPIWLPILMYGQKSGLGGLRLKPIVQMLGYEPQPPLPPNNSPLHIFYSTDGILGHHVPILLNDYLNRFGGISVVGNPITEVFPLEDGVFRQCFTSLCIDFTFSDGFKAHPAPLGLEYKKQYFSNERIEPKWREQNDVRLTINEEKPVVVPDDVQEIEVVVTKDGLPFADQVPKLTITLPDGTRREFQMDPTDQQGISNFTFPPIQARKSTLIQYEICLPIMDGERLCVEDNYAVWD